MSDHRNLAFFTGTGEMPAYASVNLVPGEPEMIELSVRSPPASSRFAKGAMVTGQVGVITMSLQTFRDFLMQISNNLNEGGV